MSYQASPRDHLFSRVAEILAPIGYEPVHVEVQQSRQRVLRIFIDHLGSNDETPAIGIEDCVKATKTMGEPLDQLPEVIALFGEAPYDLEVSSPGTDRPLRAEKDYDRFQGREARILVFRPLTALELENDVYQQKNPKQKNFLGKLAGTGASKIWIETQLKERIAIPLELISKAHLEPNFDDLKGSSKP